MIKRDVDINVGRRLKQRRTIMGLSQEAVAKAVGITFQQVQKYEKGSNAMNASRLYEFASFMNVPVAYFFEDLEIGSSIHNMKSGFAESSAETFEHEGQGYKMVASDRESLEVMKSFKKIRNQLIRKRVADLLRAIADNKTILD